MTLISAKNGILAGFLGKKSEDLSAELKKIPGIENIKKVCIDMCPSFRKGIQLALPEVETVSDRFHVVKLLNKNLWNLNKKSFKKLDEVERNKFKNVRYLLSKARKQLNKDEKRSLREYFKLNPEIKEVYWKIQDFRKILFKYQGFKRSFVSQKLTEWIQGTRKYLGKFIKTLETWWDEVVNACIFKENNGRQEGLNNKIKLIKRRGYGYRDCNNFKYRIMAECNS